MSFQVRLNKEIRSILLSLPCAHQEKVGKLIERRVNYINQRVALIVS